MWVWGVCVCQLEGVFFRHAKFLERLLTVLFLCLAGSLAHRNSGRLGHRHSPVE